MAEKQADQARQAMREAQQAKAASLELQEQLLRAEQALHSQQLFVMSLQAAADEAAQGNTHNLHATGSFVVTRTP